MSGSGRSWFTRFRRGPLGVAAVVAALGLLAGAVLGPWLAGDAADRVDIAQRLHSPGAGHWLGTDQLGRDVLARTLAAAGLSIGMALAATAIAIVAGLLAGLAPVLAGPRTRRVLVAGIDITLAFPYLLAALFFAIILNDGGIAGPVIAVGLAAAPVVARLCYTLASAVAGRDYVRAARVIGVGRVRVLWRHVLPNIAEPILVNAAATAGGSLLAFAVLSFLGIGVAPPLVDWGRMFADGMTRFYLSPHIALAPGVAIVLASLAFTVLGEALARTAGLRSAPAGRASGTPVPAGPDDGSVLRVRDLAVSFAANDTRPVDGVSFTVAAGEIVGIVGESGSGKSLTALACAGLAPPDARVHATGLAFLGEAVPAAGGRPDRATRARLGTRLTMVFQDPLASMNPALRVGTQLAEIGRTHLGMRRDDADARAVDRLAAVRIDDPRRRARQYPQQLSGGMRQRAMIGMGLMGTPRLIIADEPTTALDVTVQRQVTDLLRAARDEAGTAVLMISHDIALVAQLCDRVLVMRHGRIVEELPADRLAEQARHPYTRALIACVPGMDADRSVPLPSIADHVTDIAGGPDGTGRPDGTERREVPA